MSDTIKKITLKDGSTVYRFTIDVGVRPKIDKASGKPVLDENGAQVMTRDQRTHTFPKLGEARAEQARIISERAKGSYVAPTKITVAKLVAEWLASKRRLKSSTLRTYTDALKPVVERLGYVEAQQLTKAQVVSLVEWMRAEGRRVGAKKSTALTGRTVNVMLTLLRAVLKDAEKQGRVARNVAALVDNESHEAGEMSTWTGEQAQAFLGHVERDRLHAAWILSLYGLRRGEVLGLRWSDVDMVNRTLTIKNTRGSVAGKIVEGPPKTAKSRRTLPLDDTLVSALGALQLQQRDEADAAGEAYRSTCELCAGEHVFVDELGRPLVPATYGHRFEALTVAAKLPVIRLHDTRHTCGTLMHLRAVPVAVISAWLGHASPAFTMRQYVHSQDQAVADAGVTLAALIHAVPVGHVRKP